MVEMERYIRRGGMYWVRSEDSYGCETASSRPGVVVSSQYGLDNSPIATVVFCTSVEKTNSISVPLKNSDRPSWAMCNQIRTVDKSRLGNKLCDVSEEELEQIDQTLCRVLGLVIDTREIDIALGESKAQIAGLEEELMAKRVEIAMLERLYEKALDMLAGVHLTKDMQKPRVPRLVPDEPEVDEELERTVRPRATTVIMDDLEYHGPGKVNVNTASAKEIIEKSGLPTAVAYGVTAHRNRNGAYKSLEDLLNAPRFTEFHLKKYGGKLTV